MSMQKSAQIKADADALLFQDGIDALLRQFGDVIYTGSYELDLMVWNDIDLYLVPKQDADWDQCVANVCSALLPLKAVDTVRVEKSFWRKLPVLPQGIYVGVKIPKLGYKLPWKLDIWIVDEATRAQNKNLTESIRRGLNPNTRELIIRCKTALINEEGRTPSHSSAHVYHAVLEHGLSSKEEILAYVLGLGDSHRRSVKVSLGQ